LSTKTITGDTVYIGLTHRDISISKEKNGDYGIMGLGYLPGNACVISTFRLHKRNLEEEILKLSIHELGHTSGLAQFKNRSCFMRDAKGKNIFSELTSFCNSCSKHLKNQGWKIRDEKIV
jgi:archaemetzincin